MSVREEKNISPAQIRMARALLQISADELAQAVDMTRPSITNIELGSHPARTDTLNKLYKALYAMGVDFLPNDGVCRRVPFMGFYDGVEGWKLFSEDRYQAAMAGFTDFLSFGGVQDDFILATGQDYFDMHTKRMAAIKGFTMRALRPLSHKSALSAGYVEYRMIPDEDFPETTTYIYGNKVATIVHRPTTKIYVIEDTEAAKAARKDFDAKWKAARQQRQRNEV